MVRQHRHGRRSQRVLRHRGARDPPLLERAARRAGSDGLPSRARPVRGAAGGGCRHHRSRGRALCRSACRPRWTAGARGRDPLLLGDLRVVAARCFRARPSRRHRVSQRRPQGATGSRLSGDLAIRRRRRAHLLPDAKARPPERVCGPSQTPYLRHDRHPALPRCHTRGCLRGRSSSATTPSSGRRQNTQRPGP